MILFGTEIVLLDTILALVCLVGVMLAIVGRARRSYILKCIGMTAVALCFCLMFYLLRG